MAVSGFEISWQVRGGENEPLALQKMAFAFERAGDNLRDLGKYVFPRLIPVIEAAEEAQFDAEGQGPQRGAWAQLSAAYEAWKSANYPGQTILKREGHLYGGLTQSSSPFALRRVTSDELDFGTIGVEYASWHQTGTGRMTDRPPFDFGEEFEAEARRAGIAGARDALEQAKVDDWADLSDFHD
jgi:hypothetical protein